MTVSIHQPNFLPWYGYFYKISQSDIFIFLDDAQYSKSNYINRVKSKNGNWMTVPCKVPKLSTPISDIYIHDAERFYNKFERTLQQQYPIYRHLFDSVFHTRTNKLAELNICIIERISEYLDIVPKYGFINSSDLHLSPSNGRWRIRSRRLHT